MNHRLNRTVATFLVGSAICISVPVLASDPGRTSDASPGSSSPAAARWIVYQGVVGGSIDLVLVRPDGAGMRTMPGGPGNRWHPDWSPDGLRIAYDTNRPADDVAEIGVVDIDGADDHLLLRCVDACYGNGGPAWSPDGSTIAYDAAEGATDEHAGDLCYIGLFDLVTGSTSRILEHPDCQPADSYVRWSPDGSHLVFQRESSQGKAIFTAGVNRTGEAQLTHWGAVGRPDWSPDGSSVVFQSQDDCDCGRQTVGLLLVSADGTNERSLTDARDGIADIHPRWLPDGSAIIFSRCGGDECEVRLVAPDGTHDRALPIRAAGLAHPVWQPGIPPGG